MKTKNMKTNKKYIPEGYAVRIFMWKEDEFNIINWKNYDGDSSSMQTAAKSLSGAMKIVKQGLNSGNFTHFTLKYPISNYGNMINEPENGK